MMSSAVTGIVNSIKGLYAGFSKRAEFPSHKGFVLLSGAACTEALHDELGALVRGMLGFELSIIRTCAVQCATTTRLHHMLLAPSGSFNDHATE